MEACQSYLEKMDECRHSNQIMRLDSTFGFDGGSLTAVITCRTMCIEEADAYYKCIRTHKVEQQIFLIQYTVPSLAVSRAFFAPGCWALTSTWACCYPLKIHHRQAKQPHRIPHHQIPQLQPS
jgi:hypothetical protein